MDQHAPALLRKLARHHAADAVGRAGDESRPSLAISHIGLPGEMHSMSMPDDRPPLKGRDDGKIASGQNPFDRTDRLERMNAMLQ
jgi:hypothetical protein